MRAGWAAGRVRAQGLARRRLGPGAARRLAASTSLRDAQRALDATAYGRRVRPGQELAATQREIAATLLWDLRVLAAWLPRGGVRLLRVLAAWFELANIDELLAARSGRPAEREFELGALATAWPRLRDAGHGSGPPAGGPRAGLPRADPLLAVLATSDWRDPGGDTDYALRLGLRARYAARAAALGDPVQSWAAGAMALLVAGELVAGGDRADLMRLPGAAALLGPAALRAATLGELASGLPERARWVLAGITAPDTLWRGEAAWRARVELDGQRLLRSRGLDRQVVIGAVAVMACDAWRVRAALEIADRGGVPLEAYDELA